MNITGKELTHNEEEKEENKFPAENDENQIKESTDKDNQPIIPKPEDNPDNATTEGIP
jgi:hypothetical protein